MGAFGSATRDKRAHIFWATIIFFFSTQLIAVPQVFNRGNGSEPKDLDFHMTTGIPEFNIQQNIFEGLICKHPKTLKEIPGVAENWKISKDGKTYTFNLRKNAKWSNGDKVTAHDFVYAIQRLLEPKTAAEYAYQGFYLVNGKKFNAGEIKDFSKVGAKAKDDYTLVLTLEKPTPFFLSLMYHHSYYPLHKATVEKHGRNWTKAANIVTNGAFKVSKWEMNKVLSIVPNPHYWDKDKVKLTQVNFFPIENLDTEEKMFRTNELHMAYGVSTEKIPTWAKDKTGVFHIAPHLATYFYWINVQKPPLNNVKVRKALALGFDREKLVKYVTKGQQEPAQSFTPPGTAGYNPPKLLPKDLSRLKEAKQLLKEAGYPDGKGMPPVEILYNTENNHKKIAEALQQMWKENLGIPVTLSNQEWKVFVDNLRTHNFMLGRLGWVGDYNDPNTFLDLVVTDGGNNHAQYSNKEYDDLIARASTEMNSLKRFEYFKKAETIFLNELPLIPIYIYKRIYLLSPNVKGWYDNIEDIHPLKYVYLE
jgi:oligopeptide transport system substrate-binding protein